MLLPSQRELSYISVGSYQLYHYLFYFENSKCTIFRKLSMARLTTPFTQGPPRDMTEETSAGAPTAREKEGLGAPEDEPSDSKALHTWSQIKGLLLPERPKPSPPPPQRWFRRSAVSLHFKSLHLTQPMWQNGPFGIQKESWKNKNPQQQN